MSDLRARLRSLRAITNNRPSYASLPVPPPVSGTAQPLETLIPGDLHETPRGVSYVIRKLHPAEHPHGRGILNGWLGQNLAGAALFARDERLAQIEPRRCLFLDTETTGLNAGAGTLVFLVGVGMFTDEGFEVRQYFLRNPDEEPAMLHALQCLLDDYDALVTFNGRSFDVPMLSARYTMNGQRFGFNRWPNLDLLPPARRLWKRRLASCRLAALETAVLGVERTTEDVPGALIPLLYQEYVRTGDARQMARVVYHNLYDVLSMVTLATQLCTSFSAPQTSALPHDDLISLARWYDGLAMFDQAESAYLAALTAARYDHEHAVALEGLALLMKRQDRHDEAVPYWEALASLSPTNLIAPIELAKYYEWTAKDLRQALDWTESALQIAQRAPYSVIQQEALHDIQHRLERLSHKISR